MEMPKQVEEAAELAEQLHAQMFTPKEEEGNPVDPPEVIDPEPDGGEPKDEPVPHDDDVAELRKFKERYLHLKGKYDAEVPRLHQDLRELKQSVFEKLEKVSTTKAAEPEPEPQDLTDDFVNAFAENYGEDFAENLRKLIALEAQKLQQPIQGKVDAFEETQLKAAQTNFVNYIDTALNDGREKPIDWQAMWSGKDPKFLEFLAQPDPSGLYTYGELAAAYNEKWEADKLVNIFKLYADANTTKVEQTTEPKPRVAHQQKEALVAPSRTNTHVAPNTQSKQVWTQDMIQEFQKLDRQGKYSADESKALWDDLLSALGENRIR